MITNARKVTDRVNSICRECSMVKERLSLKAKRFLDYYYGPEGSGNGRRSAELAGYGSPENASRKLKRSLAKRMAEIEAKLAEKAQLSAEQIVQELCKVAKDDKNPAQKVRALEILSKIHGLHSDKVNVTVNREALSQDLDKALATLAKLASNEPSLLREIEPSPTVTSIGTA